MKESIKFNISVEGINCETLYFEHLENLINNCENAKYKAKFFVKQKNPLSFAKSRINTYSQKGKKGEGFIKYFHIQDIEDYDDEYQRNKFHHLIDEISKAKKYCNISTYDLGYSNFTFDLWIVLHKYNLNTPVQDRHQYYKYINKGFCKNYSSMNEYKTENEFRTILSQITLDDVITAISRAKAIRKTHEDNKEHLEIYNKFSYYRNNPDLTINEIVEEILIDCGVI